MATVPIYDQPQVNPNVGQMPAFQAQGVEPMRDFTGKQIEEAGQAQTNLGANIMRIAEKQAEIEEQSLLDRTEVDLRSFIVDFTRENEGSTGEKASGITEKFSTAYFKRVSDFATELSKGGKQNSRLLKRFENKASEIGLTSIAKFSTFEAAQKQEVRVNNNKALGKMLSNTASSVPFSLKDGKIYDGPEFEKSKTDLIENLKKRADLLGYGEDSDVYKQLVKDELSSVYMDRMANIINTNPLAAPAYFDQVKEFITNDEFKNKFKGMATKVAQEAEAEGWVESKFAEALEKKDKTAISNLYLEITKKFSGDQQKIALGIYNNLEQGLSKQQEKIRNDFENEAWGYVEENRTSWNGVPNTTKEWLRENDRKTYNAINRYIKQNIEADREKAERQASDRRREAREIAKDKRDAEKEKHSAAFYDLNTQMSDDPKAFMSMNLNNWRADLSPEDFRYFAKKQSDFKLNPNAEKQSTTLNDRINVESTLLKIDKNKQKKAQFTKIINSDVDTFIANNNGKYPDAKQLNAIINDAKKEWTTNNWIGITSKIRRYEGTKVTSVNEIPKPILEEIQTKLKERKIQSSNEDIIKIYHNYMGLND